MKHKTSNLKLTAILFALVCFLLLKPAEGNKRGCVCLKYGYTSDLCTILSKNLSQEVFVVHEGKSNFKTWHWDTITGVISTNDSYNEELMCLAHSKHKKYGIIEKIPGTTNISDDVFVSFKNKLDHHINQELDLLAFDLLDIVGDCQRTDGESADDAIKVIKYAINIVKRRNVQILCIVPYKPPCFNNDCRYLTMNLLSQKCDLVITSPESYITYCDLNCKARATVPETKLVVGVDEYLTSGISEKKLMIGIPWHGYDYTCYKFTKKEIGQPDICEVAKIPGNESKFCDFTPPSRKKITFAVLNNQYKSWLGNHEFSNLYKAPYFNIANATKGTNFTHQVWFEGSGSLMQKYTFAREMGLRGVVIWSADDISNAGPGQESNDNGAMWAWVLHSLYVTDQPVHDISLAGKMAAVGVGCFVVGAGIGLLVACVIQRSRGIKRHQPFALDEDPDIYHDDDNVL